MGWYAVQVHPGIITHTLQDNLNNIKSHKYKFQTKDKPKEMPSWHTVS